MKRVRIADGKTPMELFGTAKLIKLEPQRYFLRRQRGEKFRNLLTAEAKGSVAVFDKDEERFYQHLLSGERIWILESFQEEPHE